MRSASLVALSAPLLASAAPLFARNGPTDADKLVFKFAHVLEQLETEFYTQAIAKFKVEDFLAAGYSSAEVAVEQLQTIVSDEAAHTGALEGAIKAFGDQPITNCQFNFESVLTDVATTMTAARLVEQVGVGAYLGAAGLLSDPRFLTSAASILTIEARHQTVLNSLNGGATVPQAFDIPLGPEQVVSIAGGFISGCDVGIKGTPALAITNTGPVSPGTLLTFSSDAVTAAQGSGATLFCNMITGGATMAISLPIDQCVVPAGILGPVAIVITSDAQPLLAADLVDQAKKEVVAGPALGFIDFGEKEQTLAQLILTPSSKLTKDLNGVSGVAASCQTGGACDPVDTESTKTISPEQASGAINVATAPATAPVLEPTQTFMGDVLPVMPTAGAEAPASGPLEPLGSAGIPLPEANTVAGSDGLPLPTETLPLGSDGYPAPTGDVVPPEAGSGASQGGDIIPLAPPAGAEASTSGPEITEAGNISVAAPPTEAGAVVVSGGGAVAGEPAAGTVVIS